MAAVEGGLEASQRGVVGRYRPLAQNELSEMLTRQADMRGLFISAALITITQLRSSTRRTRGSPSTANENDGTTCSMGPNSSWTKQGLS